MRHTLVQKAFNVLRFYFRFGIDGSLYYIKEHSKRNKGELLEFRSKELKYPIIMRKGTSDFKVFIQVIYELSYRIFLKDKPEVIIDCGANIGLATVYFKQRYPNAQIYAIEPDLENFNILCKNIQPYTGIKALRAGIWHKETDLLISNTVADSWGFRVEECKEKYAETIPAYSLSYIMKKYSIQQIDLLKIDIEGTEKNIFEEDCDYWLSRTKTLIIETHDGIVKGSTKTLFRALEKYDYHCIPSGENFLIYFEIAK